MVEWNRCTFILVGAFLLWLLCINIIESTMNNKPAVVPYVRNGPGPYIKGFGVSIEIPDLPNKHSEGGFHLYFYSPELKIKRLLAYRFDTGETVSHRFNISELRVTLEQFRRYMPNMVIYSNSKNVFNASKVMLYALLDNGQTVYGEQALNSEMSRDDQTGYIRFNGMMLT